jgi:hypothetical protein
VGFTDLHCCYYRCDCAPAFRFSRRVVVVVVVVVVVTFQLEDVEHLSADTKIAWSATKSYGVFKV